MIKKEVIKKMAISLEMILERANRVKTRLEKNEKAIESREAYMKSFRKRLENAQKRLDITLKEKKELEDVLFPLLEKYDKIKKKETNKTKNRNEMRGGLINGQKDLDRLYNNRKCDTEKLQKKSYIPQ